MEIVTLRPQGPDQQNNHRLTIMAPQISDEMRARIIVWHHEQHLSPQEIADLAGCCVRTVYNILSYHRDFGTLRNSSTRGRHMVVSVP